MPVYQSQLVPSSSPQDRWGFSGHETFPFRYGWLKKAVDGVVHDPLLMGKDHAIVELGVGKNMVQSIRHWGLATQLLQETEGVGLEPSSLGNLLLNQWDPYLEEPASLWLVHWLLATNPRKAATWHLAFSYFRNPDFTKRQLTEFILDMAARHQHKVKESSLMRDIDCFLRTYMSSKIGSKGLVEDTFDCPLTELGLIRPLRDGESFQFSVGKKPSLPSQVVAYALLEYMGQERPFLALSSCTYDPGSPGQVFKLDENSMVEHLEEIQILTDGALEIDDTIGLKQVYRRGEVFGITLLDSYYSKGYSV